MLNQDKNITVFGGSGFIGRYIVQALAKSGARVRVAVRNPNSAHFTTVYGNPGQVVPVFCNIRDFESVRSVTNGSEMVVNAVGILFESGRQSFKKVHIDGAKNIAKSAKIEGIKNLVHISSIGVSEDSESEYAKSKFFAEEALKEHFPETVILRSSLVFGAEDKFFNRFATMACFSPAIPLIGGGNTKFQPIYVGDIAKAVTKILDDDLKEKIYEIGGAEILTFKELMQKMLHIIGRKRLLVPVPFFIAKLKAAFLELLPNPLLTSDQLKLLKYDNVVSGEYPSLKDLDISPTMIDTILPKYLYRFRKGGDYNLGKSYDYKDQDDL